MADVIATVWDFDKTLIAGYMQEPLFEKFGVDGKSFWQENEREIDRQKKAGLDVNRDTFYLNLMLRYTKKGKPFYGLNNDDLKALGQHQKFFEGAIDLFKSIVSLNEDKIYREYDIKFENYIVSTGLKKIIEGSEIAPYVTRVWGAEFIDAPNEDGRMQIGEVCYSLDNSTKTRALFEINKGAWSPDLNIDVNTKIPEDLRRVRFCNMVYVADGPSDVPAFSLIGQHNGATLAVYPRGCKEALHSVEKLRRDGRVQMLAEADYRSDSTASMWIMDRLRSQADDIVSEKKARLNKLGPGTPRHMT